MTPEPEEPVDEDEDDLEEGLEEGFEHCPVCDRLNCPGAADHCEHFFGTNWDGEIIWSDRMPAFEDAWESLCSLLGEELDDEDGDPLERCRRIARARGLDAAFLKASLINRSTSTALMCLLSFELGDDRETEGMLSGSGYSLYLYKVSDFDGLVARIEHFVHIARDAML